MTILCVGCNSSSSEAQLAQRDERVHFLLAQTMHEATAYMNGPENIGLVLIGDVNDVQQHVTFVATIRPFFSGLIVAIGQDIGTDQALLSAGCTHLVGGWAEASDMIRQHMVGRS